jgi:hypothetical protein
VENGAFIRLVVLWKENNDRSFEDCERTLEEIKSFFICLFYTFYIWTVAFFNTLVISHHDFIVLFSLFS